MTDVLADRAVSFIDKATSPFFLHFSVYAPHQPALPAPRHVKAFANEPPHRPPSFDVQASGGSPAARYPALEKWMPNFIDSYHRNALASLLAVDDAVEAVVNAVERKGQLDNTVFIFMSDNGYLFGEHRIVGKVWPYEESIRVPLIIRLPGSHGATTDPRLVQNIDIAPTIAELAGLGTLRVTGHSLVPLLHGENSRWRQELVFEYLGDKEAYFFPPRYKAIRTDHLKLVEYEDGSRELFDLSDDPNELHNLAGSAAGREFEDALEERLADLLTPLGLAPQRTSTASRSLSRDDLFGP
jgi:arylsulfatase A-like enzyme